MTSPANELIELKPCPFCGKQPRECADDSYGSARVWCPDDNECWGQPEAFAILSAGETLEDAKRKWNTRSIQDGAGVEVERESFELFKLRSLLDLANEHDAQIIRETIRHVEELEHQVARDDELWRGTSIRRAEGSDAEHLRHILQAARPYISDKAGVGIISAIDAALADTPCGIVGEKG